MVKEKNIFMLVDTPSKSAVATGYRTRLPSGSTIPPVRSLAINISKDSFCGSFSEPAHAGGLAMLDRVAFVKELLAEKEVERVLLSDDALDVCAILSEPSTENILKCCRIYSESIASGDYFRFEAYGDGEIDLAQGYSIEITKGEPDAIGSEA